MRASAVPDDCLNTLSVANVSKTFKQVNIQTDYQDVNSKHVLTKWQVPSWTFSTCPLTESVIPTCFMQTTIVPVPKNTKVAYLNVYRPVALTSVAIKCFERLVMAHINTIIPEPLDPLQFAYHINRSTDDAISIALHTALSHLDKRHTCVRMLFIEYSSAFKHHSALKAHQ